MVRKNFSTLAAILLFSIAGLLLPPFVAGQQPGSPFGPSGPGSLGGNLSDALRHMDRALEPSVSDMTLEDEYYLGRAVAAGILRVYRPYTADPALTAYLNNIVQAIVINSPRPVLFSGYHVEILDTNEIAAFATPGGHIFISRGLIALAPSEDALAAVLAHEIAHIQLRHVLSIIENERLVQDLTAVGDRAAAIAAHSPLQKRAVLLRASLSLSLNTLFRDGYSREQEFQADQMAELLLVRAGYDPVALRELLVLIGQRPQTGNMSSTHPSPAMRIANLGNITGGTGQSTLSTRRARFNSALRR